MSKYDLIGLKGYAKRARSEGYPVTGGINGGGYIRLAKAIGIEVDNKRSAKRALANHFDNLPRIPRPEKPTQSTRVAKQVHPTDDAFLKSFEWRRLRMKVLTKYGRRCMCCGGSPDDGLVIHVDHIKPRKTHPELALSEDNLQVLCEVCNHGKGNWDSTDWRPAIDPEMDSNVAHIRSIMQS